jgi:chemotaxis protein methyltransferase CheR
MNALTAENLISDLSNYVGFRMGISLPPEKYGELEKKISMAADSLGFPDAASCIQWVLSSRTDRHQLEILASWLTVGETYFFRENKSLRALTEQAFPDIIRAHAHGDKRLRIWSAGCATGEEPYSLAMLASECPGLNGWEVSILGTDINQAFLRKAEAGIYSEWSFRGVAPGIREKFFQKSGGSTLEVLPEIKSMVTFAHLNLIEDVYPALLNNTNAIDLILCRNVLMYFTPDNTQKILRKFHQSLLQDGWLLVSPVEAPLVDRLLFTPLLHTAAVLHRKADARQKRYALPHLRTPPRAPQRPAPVAELHRPAATYSRAMELYANADYDGAIDILNVLAARPVVDFAIFQLLTRTYANKGRLSEAEIWCTRAMSADPMNAASRYLLALIRIEQQRPDDAMSALRKAIYLEPDFVVAHFTLANLYLLKRKHRESERHLRNALLALRSFRSEEVLPESEGITAGKLIEMIAVTRADGGNNGQRRIER